MSAKSVISPNEIQLNVEASGWEDAIQKAAQPLVDEKHITDDYVQSMIESVKKLGPYIVIAPGLALGHARPSAAVKQTSFSVATLKEPVEFGNEQNDPVDLVVILASINSNDHLDLMRKVVNFLNKADNLKFLRRAATETDKVTIVESINGGAVE
ncbi:PTS sugar transporter subunit IIA [Levilactobacillus zymae]|uniref:PTS sugar transporter subunit IIA n=1 Tax=Levilactobacillus zymae TaxID=267363 RepID=UPI0028B891A0|nr:PTS sugar transporter subunit IIA [Levilactobacillus zymae]MDT6981473.1 PTS sugar transporter subunit IIA [Levilactobacillus zymae]